MHFDDAQYDMENSFFALAPKCSRNVDEDHLIFKSYYIYDILAPKFDPQGGCILTPLGTPSKLSEDDNVTMPSDLLSEDEEGNTLP